MMNRGHVLEMSSSPVQQQIMANPSWWNNINGVIRPSPQPPMITSPPPHPPLPPRHPIHQPSYYYGPSSNLSSPSLSSYPSVYPSSFVPTWRGDINQEELQEEEEEELPYDQSLSQLLLYGLAGDQDQKDNTLNDGGIHGKLRSFENWASHQQYLQAPSPNASSSVTDSIKEDIVINSPVSGNYRNRLFVHPAGDDFTVENSAASRSTNNSSNKLSCVTTLGKKNTPDPASGKKPSINGKRLGRDPSSECEGSISGGNSQKRVKNHSSSQTPQANIKVRKEKLGDRITTLHQLVSPFGKTDTASVLLEAIGYIRFLQGQIEALSSPYFGSSGGSGTAKLQKTELHGESKIDLRSRGLCLVPISCTTRVGNDDINGADFWAPALGSPAGLFR